MKDVVLEVQNLGIRFWIERREIALVRDILFHPFRRQSLGKDLWALHNISFSLMRGRVLGVIGKNGAGKTTLLMALAGIYSPDEGAVIMKGTGKVTSLLEIGAGFRWDLTGRENVYLYAAIMGIPRREVKALFDMIVEFAGLEDFIDAPMRTYSSGMRMRLGFAVAVSVQPDVLLVDEALGIGDSAFQNRALEYIQRFRRRGGALVYVSHDMNRVGDLCDECLLLEKGRMVCFGKPLEVIAAYWEEIWGKHGALSAGEEESGFLDRVKYARRWGSGEIRITGFSILDRWGRTTNTIERGSPVRMEIGFRSNGDSGEFIFQVSLFQDKTTVAVMKSDPSAFPRDVCRKGGTVSLSFDSTPLAVGVYSVDVEIRNEAFTKMYDHIDKFVTLTIAKGDDKVSRPEWLDLPCRWRVSGGNCQT